MFSISKILTSNAFCLSVQFKIAFKQEIHISYFNMLLYSHTPNKIVQRQPVVVAHTYSLRTWEAGASKTEPRLRPAWIAERESPRSAWITNWDPVFRKRKKKYTEKYFSGFFFYFNELQMVFFNDRVISFEKFKANHDFIIIHTLKKFPRTSDIFNQSLKVKSNQIFFLKYKSDTWRFSRPAQLLHRSSE